MTGMFHCGTKHDGLAVPGQLAPFAHHGLVVYSQVQHLGGLVHVILAGTGLAQGRQLFVRAAQGTDESTRPDQKAHADKVMQTDLGAAIVEHRAQPLAVAARGRGRDAENFTSRVLILHGLHYFEITGGSGVVRLVNDQSVQLGDGRKISRQSLHHCESGVSAPGFSVGSIQARGAFGVHGAELAQVLGHQLVTVLEHALLAAELPGHSGQDNGLPAAGTAYGQGVATLAQRGQGALDHCVLIGTEDHGGIFLHILNSAGRNFFLFRRAPQAALLPQPPGGILFCLPYSVHSMKPRRR